MKRAAHFFLFSVATAAALLLAACSHDNGTAPETPDTGYQARHFTRDDLTPSGDVTQTADGYTVKGELDVKTDQGSVAFANADLDVQFDANNRLRSVSGKVEIPSPSKRVSFADPVQADVGFFTGAYLNQNRDFNILLDDNTDYFVFNVQAAFEMDVATGDTGAEATKPISVKAPLGGQILMIIDYNDPMYYVYGEQDLLGGMGMGWSLNGRIPFVPWHPVNGMGKFNGKTIRTGTFPIAEVLTVDGEMVDNETTEIHLSQQDPFSPDLRMDYKVGYNGAMSFDVGIKDVVGFTIPIAEGSGGMWREISTQDIFRGHAYINGVTTDDFSWWPSFIEAKPASSLQASGFIKSNGDFDVTIAGKYGWILPNGEHSMAGLFEVSPEAMVLSGKVTDGDVDMSITGNVTADATTVAVVPPPQLQQMISGQVNDEVDSRIAEAQKAYDDLQKATQDYEFELSLRGLRPAIPPAVDTAESEVKSRIAAEKAKYKNAVYYSQIKSHLNSVQSDILSMLDNLKAKAQSTTDNDAWRAGMEAALRQAASYKIYNSTFNYKVAGVTVKTVHISVRVLSDDLAAKLLTAADNVKYIKATSDVKVQMQQVYDNIPEKEIFERVKDDIHNGVVSIPTLSEFGFALTHDDGAMTVYATINGERHDVADVDPFSIASMAGAVASEMVDMLIGQ